MTPADRDEFRKMLAQAIQPLRDEVDSLRATDKRHDVRLTGHSGTHRDLATNVRASLHEVKEATNGDLLRAVTHLSGVIEANRSATNAELGHLNAELEKLKNVPAQSTVTASAAIDTKLAVDKGQAASKHRAYATIIVMVIIGLINHYAKAAP